MASSSDDVFTRLKERREARLVALEQRKKEEQEEKRVEETSEYFSRQFEQNKRGKLSHMLSLHHTMDFLVVPTLAGVNFSYIISPALAEV